MINGIITSVRSGYGHRFMGTDKEMEESCLTCGAVYHLVLTPDETYDADYQASNGDYPNHCSHRTDLVHGVERVCQAANGRGCEASQESGVCEHTDHECNCVSCD